MMFRSNNNSLRGNNVRNNYMKGIYLDYSIGNLLSENNVESNDHWGIQLEFTSNNNTFIGNFANGNGYHGIMLADDSHYNTFLWNQAHNNDEYGVYLTQSNNNTFYLNSFRDNILGSASCTETLGTVWDNGTLGNYWCDYSEKYPAAFNNGRVWNYPYQIDENNIDRYPLVNPDASSSQPESPSDSPTTTQPSTTQNTNAETTTETEDNDSVPNFRPPLWILGIILAALVGIVIIVQMRKRVVPHEENEYEFEPVVIKEKKQKKRKKKRNLDLIQYEYDPDEPQL